MSRLMSVLTEKSGSVIAPNRLIGTSLTSYSVTSNTSIDECAGAMRRRCPWFTVLSEIVTTRLFVAAGGVPSSTGRTS